MRLVMLIAALLLLLAGCSGSDGGPRPSSLNVIGPPGQYIEPPPIRPAPMPLGVGLPGVQRVAPAPRRQCQIKTKTVVNNGHKRTTKYQVCK